MLLIVVFSIHLRNHHTYVRTMCAQLCVFTVYSLLQPAAAHVSVLLRTATTTVVRRRMAFSANGCTEHFRRWMVFGVCIGIVHSNECVWILQVGDGDGDGGGDDRRNGKRCIYSSEYSQKWNIQMWNNLSSFVFCVVQFWQGTAMLALHN